MTDHHRPYVVPRITDRGTILLLDDEQREFHVRPGDAAELAVQILRTYCRTYGFTVFVPLPNERENWPTLTESGRLDPDSLRVGEGVGGVVATALGATPDTESLYTRIRGRVLAEARRGLGIRD